MKEIFKKGTKVRVNAAGITGHGGRKLPNAGIVVGFSKKDPECVRVLWDRKKTPEVWTVRYLDVFD